MAISITRYIDITSGVAANIAVDTREFILRIFTDNILLPPDTYLEFMSASQVAQYFGSTSEEYARAAVYFSFISKNSSRPLKISFARWVDAAVAPMIFGDVIPQSLSAWTAISNGSIGLTIGGTAHMLTGLDFTGAVSLAGVAAIIQTAVNAQTGTMWTSATVSFDSTRGSFDFVGGSAIDAVITVQQGVGGTPIGVMLGWLSGPRLIIANGSIVETLTDTLIDSSGQSNNFGSFLFMPNLNLSQITEVATWNATQNVSFIYTVGVSSLNAVSYATTLASYEGTCLTISDTSGEYPEELPAMVFAATQYQNVNSTQNYMFQIDLAFTPSVSDDTTADSFDAVNVNYIGVTQTAGQFLSFYQRGVMMGGPTAPTDLNTFANEAWLRDAAGAAVMTLLLALPKVSANASGQGQILSQLQTVVNQALLNGTISVNKPLTNTQILEIGLLTGDDQAYLLVENQGYWLNCTVSPSTNSASYLLIYSKDDVIRKVIGTHVLI